MSISKYLRHYEYVVICIILASLSLVLGTLLFRSGPRLSSVELQQTTVSEQIILTFSTPLNSAAEPSINIWPEVDFQYITSGERIIIRPKQPLAYDTSYALTVANVQDSRGKSSTISTTFKTTNPQLFYLKRDKDGMDNILETTLSSQSRKMIFQASTILDYSISSESMLIVTEQPDKTQQLMHFTGNKEKLVPIPQNTKITQLSGSSTHDAFVLILQDITSYKSTAYTFSAKDGLLPVTNVDQSQLEALSIIFAPDGNSYVYQSAAGILYIDDPSDASEPLSLGTVEKVNRFLPDSSGIFIFDSSQFSTIDAQSGQLEPAPAEVQAASSSQQFLKRSKYTYITQNLNDDLELRQNVTMLDGGIASTISETVLKERLILQLKLSPNDQFIVTEEASQPVIYDGASLLSQPTNVATIIRHTDGRLQNTIDGFHLQWRLR